MQPKSMGSQIDPDSLNFKVTTCENNQLDDLLSQSQTCKGQTSQSGDAVIGKLAYLLTMY